MKLKINGFENEIIFDDETVNILSIKDAKCFSHIIDILNNKMNGIESNEIFLLDNAENELSIEKEAFMALDLFNIDYNSKKILNKIYTLISENISKNQDYEIHNMTVKLRNYIINEINELPFEFIMKDELEISEILKLYNLKIDNISYNSIIEKVEILVDLLSTLNIAQLLIIPNLKSYLSNEELVEFYKYVLYNNINLLVIERESKKQLKYEKNLIIDEQFNEEIK